VNGAVAPDSRVEGAAYWGTNYFFFLSTNLKLLCRIQENLINNFDCILVYNFCWGGLSEY